MRNAAGNFRFSELFLEILVRNVLKDYMHQCVKDNKTDRTSSNAEDSTKSKSFHCTFLYSTILFFFLFHIFESWNIPFNRTSSSIPVQRYRRLIWRNARCICPEFKVNSNHKFNACAGADTLQRTLAADGKQHINIVLCCTTLCLEECAFIFTFSHMFIWSIWRLEWRNQLNQILNSSLKIAN